MRARHAALVVLALAAGMARADAPDGGASARLEGVPPEAPLAEPFGATIVVTVPEGWTVPEETPGPDLGDVSVLDGAWEPAGRQGAPTVRRWVGRLAAYRLGEVRVPPIPLTVLAPDGSSRAVATGEATLTVRGNLADEGNDAAPAGLADLKPPATVPPDYRRLGWALAILALVLLAAAGVWWAQRRLAGRLARVPVDADPFRRMAPDAWAYEELRALLARRFAEEGREDLFHAELARIVKQYLSGRYRVDLLERTTGEMEDALRQGGMDRARVVEVVALLERADLAKFARVHGGADACRAAVEEAYGIVDRTRARPEPAEAGEAA
jgi:hypothetical protein